VNRKLWTYVCRKERLRTKYQQLGVINQSNNYKLPEG